MISCGRAGLSRTCHSRLEDNERRAWGQPWATSVVNYSLCFKIKVIFGQILRYKIKVMFGLKLLYEIKVTFGEIFVKLRQTNWNVAIYNVNVVAYELPSQITIYTCLTIDILTQRRRRTSTRFYVWDRSMSIVNGDERACCLPPLAHRKVLSERYAMHAIAY